MPITMPILQGRFSHKVRSLAALTLASAHVLSRRAIGRPLVAGWSPSFEIANLFWRGQFNHAFALKNISEGRSYFDSLYQHLGESPKVDVRPSLKGEPRGHWYIPRTCTSEATMLHFHGGGYAFHSTVSRLFVAMLADVLELPIFAPDYRLTPEHPHPAQIDDALESYRFLLDKGVDPSRLVVCGDSAGGHLMLMTIAKLRELGLPQPAIGIGISPWTDVRPRGASLFGHDQYDLVQGYMTQTFAAWLAGAGSFTDDELSPINQDFRGLAPLYLQAGGKEILVDMIRDFAGVSEAQGANVRLDAWEHMTHEFHSWGQYLPESLEALRCIGEAIRWAIDPVSSEGTFLPTTRTEIDTLVSKTRDLSL